MPCKDYSPPCKQIKDEKNTLPLQPCNGGGEDSADDEMAADGDAKMVFGSDDEEEESENDDWFDQLVSAQLSSDFSDADMGNDVGNEASDSQVAPTELDTQMFDDENPFASPWKDKPISDDVSRPVARPLASQDKSLPVFVVHESPERADIAKIKADRIAQLKAKIKELEGELAQEGSAFDGLGAPAFFRSAQFHFLFPKA